MKKFVRTFSTLWRICIFLSVGPLGTVAGMNLLLGRGWMAKLPQGSVILLVVVGSYAVLYLSIACGFSIIFALERRGWLTESEISEDDPPGVKAIDAFKLTYEAVVEGVQDIWDKDGEDKSKALASLFTFAVLFGVIGFTGFIILQIVFFS